MIQRPVAGQSALWKCRYVTHKDNKTMSLKPNKTVAEGLSLLFTNLQNLLNPLLDLQFSLLHHETLMPHSTWWQPDYNPLSFGASLTTT